MLPKINPTDHDGMVIFATSFRRNEICKNEEIVCRR